MNSISMTLNADELILSALKEDISSEDVSTNAVMPNYQLGEVELICKQDGVIAGLQVFVRVFELLDAKTEATLYVKDGDTVTVDVEGKRRTRWYDVQVRVHPEFRLEMHIDTDDANAVGIGNGAKVKLIKR